MIEFFSNFSEFFYLTQSAIVPGVIAFDLLCFVCSLIWPFLFCCYANTTFEQVLSIGDDAFNLNWYGCPNDVQKFIILIVQRAYEVKPFVGLGLIPCTLEIFGRVILFLSISIDFFKRFIFF